MNARARAALQPDGRDDAERRDVVLYMDSKLGMALIGWSGKTPKGSAPPADPALFFPRCLDTGRCK